MEKKLKIIQKNQKNAGIFKKRKGFTLMELIIVIVVIGIIMGALGYSYLGQIDKAKYSTAEKELVSLKSALDQYLVTHNGTFIGLFANGASAGDMTGPSALANLDKLEPFLSKPMSSVYDPWQKPYKIKVDYDTTTNQGDIAIYVEGKAADGVNSKTVNYKTIAPDGTEGTFSVANVGINPNKKARGVAGSAGEAMIIRVLGQYEMQ